MAELRLWQFQHVPWGTVSFCFNPSSLFPTERCPGVPCDGPEPAVTVRPGTGRVESSIVLFLGETAESPIVRVNCVTFPIQQ